VWRITLDSRRAIGMGAGIRLGDTTSTDPSL